jgi:hypothetical protein
MDGWMDRLDQNKSTKTIGSYQNRRKYIFKIYIFELYNFGIIYLFIIWDEK